MVNMNVVGLKAILYNDSSIFKILKKTDGVSLEKLRPLVGV